ncbi:MAG TPA: glycoside hydrolase family 3 N-terminal domain-containing protein [Gemmatimonadales bacterium]|nr:glycoside hydrolase family 3 N-terminal domain-containing protein [Gemmatimonadales bacterium]
MHLRSLAPWALAAGALASFGVAPVRAAQAVEAQAPDPAVDRILATLSLHDRAAQLVMPWLPGTYASADDPSGATVRRWVDSLHVGGLIVSVGSPLDIAARLNRLQRRSRLPLLIASDLEEGTARRLAGGTAFPTNMGVAAGGRESDAYAMGRVTAEEGRAVGIRLAFAPVADVNSNPDNPIINVRSFGADPRAVARFVSAEVRGMQEHGVLATVKHFPGHGDTDINSHLSLPVIHADWARLDSLELVPFRAAIAAGAAGVMSAHIAVPALDGGRTEPGTIDPGMLTGVLRDSLGFRGLVVTDALDMAGLVRGWGADDAPVLALMAGADLLLQPADPDGAVDAIVRAVRDGRITRARLDRSVRRVLAMKHRAGLFRHRTVPLDGVSRAVGSAEHLAVASGVATRSIVLLDDGAGALDSLRSAPRRVALVAYGEEPQIPVGHALAAGLRDAGDTVALFRLWPASGPASYDSARALLGGAGTALFAVAVRAIAGNARVAIPDALAALINATARSRATVLLSLGSPYIIRQTPAVGTYLIAWSANPISETAAARALSGAAIGGRLPISIPPAFPLGAGLDRPETRRGGTPTLTSERR